MGKKMHHDLSRATVKRHGSDKPRPRSTNVATFAKLAKEWAENRWKSVRVTGGGSESFFNGNLRSSNGLDIGRHVKNLDGKAGTFVAAVVEPGTEARERSVAAQAAAKLDRGAIFHVMHVSAEVVRDHYRNMRNFASRIEAARTPLADPPGQAAAAAEALKLWTMGNEYAAFVGIDYRLPKLPSAGGKAWLGVAHVEAATEAAEERHIAFRVKELGKAYDAEKKLFFAGELDYIRTAAPRGHADCGFTLIRMAVHDGDTVIQIATSSHIIREDVAKRMLALVRSGKPAPKKTAIDKLFAVVNLPAEGVLMVGCKRIRHTDILDLGTALGW